MPPEAEGDFGLNELTDFEYSTAILSDTFKPDSFNINLREDTRPLAAALADASDGEVELQLGGAHLASFSTVPQTGWKLVIIAPKSEIFAAANTLRSQLQTVGYLMLAGLLVFYGLFFAILLVRARTMSELVARPLTEISGLIERIGEKDLDPQFAGSPVLELDMVGKQLLHANRLLHTAERETGRQTLIAEDALVKLQAANDEMVMFARLMSHQIRTPLSVIDSSAQIIHRKAETVNPEDLRNRVGRLRGNVAAIADLLSNLVARFDRLAGDLADGAGEEPTDLRREVTRLANELIVPEKLRLQVADEDHPLLCATVPLVAAIRDVIGHAVLHAKEDQPIEIGVSADAAHACVTVIYAGPPIEPAGPNAAAGTDAEWERSMLRRIGVSLYLVRKAVEDNGGTIAFASAAELTSIAITIPCKRSTEPGTLDE